MKVFTRVPVLALLAASVGWVSVDARAADLDDHAICCAAADRSASQTILYPLPPSDRIVVIGDSLTAGVVSPSFLGSETMPALLAASGRSVFSDARVGRSVNGGLVVVSTNRPVIGAADVAMIGLGTNHVTGPALSVAAARSSIARMTAALRAVNPDIRIVWVDVSVEYLVANTLNWNQALAEIAAADSAFEVCGWRQFALTHPEWLEPDRVHLRIPGYAALRDVLIRCLIVGSD